MSTSTEISRLTTARNTIRDKLIDLGLAASTDKLDVLATAIDGIANRGSISATVMEGDTYTIPAGYHNGSGTVSGVAGGGNYTLQSKTITPTKSQQSVTPDSGYYGLSDVTVAAIPEAYQNVSGVTAAAADVLSGKVIVDATGATLTGTMANNGAVNKTLDASTNNQQYTVPAGYHNGSGKVKIVLESKNATPTTSSQTVTPTTGKVLSSVTVNAIPTNFADTSDDDALAAHLLDGKTAHSWDSTTEKAVAITGTMPNNGAVSQTLDVRSGHTSYTVPAGYHNGSGTVSIVTETKSATPTKSSQTISATSGKVLSSVTVAAIPAAYQDVTAVDAVAADVLDGKKIVNSSGTVVTGTMPENGALGTTTLDATEDNQSYSIPAGHTSGGTVKIVLENKTATPSASSQNIVPTDGKVLSKVTVNAIPANWGNTTGDTGVAADVLSGKKVHSISSGSAVAITGSMPNNGAVSATIDVRSGHTSYTVPLGYHDGTGTVSLVTETKSATPTTASQTITPASGKVLSSVTVNAIPDNFADTTGDDATAAQILSGKIAHSYNSTTGKAVAVTGTMANNGALSATLDVRSGHTSYTIPAGYTTGGTVNLVTETKTATPTKAVQNIAPTDGKVLSKVTVNAIPAAYQDVTNVDAAAGDVLAGKIIVAADGTEVTGSMTNNGAVTKVLDATASNQSYTVPAGYHNGSGAVSIVLETKTATPSASAQNITPTAGKVLSKVTVNAIPANWGNTTGDTAVAANLLAGATAHSISNGAAVQITGTMPNNGAIAGTIDGLTTTSYTVPAGYTTGGTVSLTDDIETALAAI